MAVFILAMERGVKQAGRMEEKRIAAGGTKERRGEPRMLRGRNHVDCVSIISRECTKIGVGRRVRHSNEVSNGT